MPARARLTSLLRGRGEGPFAEAGPRAIAHCSHHKAGTVWFMRVLSSLAENYGLRFLEHDLGSSAADADVVVYNHSRYFDWADYEGRALRGTHLLRDPRDVAVSGYHYHLWTEEKWARLPRESFGGQSYQEELQRLDFEQGLLLEIEVTSALQLKEMLAWDYDRPEFLELRYETFIEDDVAGFRRVFEHYGLTPAATERALEAVADASFARVTGRELGESDAQSHLRSGRPGEWREQFGPAHVAKFKEVAPGALARLGYEPDDDWGV